MRDFHKKMSEEIQTKLQAIDLEGYNISIEEAITMIKYLQGCLAELRDFFVSFPAWKKRK